MEKVDKDPISSSSQKAGANRNCEEICPKLQLPSDILQDMDDLCTLLDMKREEFIVEAIHGNLILYHENPEMAFDQIVRSNKFIRLFERIRGNLNKKFGKTVLIQKYFEK